MHDRGTEVLGSPVGNFVGAGFIYALSATPVIGDLMGMVLLSYLAPLLVTLGMVQIVFSAITGYYPLAAMLLPLSYFGFGIGQGVAAYLEVNALRSQIAATNPDQPNLAGSGAPRAIKLVDIQDQSPRRMLEQFALKRVVTSNTRDGKVISYTILRGDRRPAGGARSTPVGVVYWRVNGPAGSQGATIKRSPSDGAGVSTTVRLASSEKVEGYGGGTIDEYVVRRAGRLARFRHGTLKVPSGIIFPIVIRGPISGESSQLQMQWMGTYTANLDPDGLSISGRIASTLGIGPQDYTRWN